MASFEPFVSSDPFSMSTFNSKLGGAFGKVDADVKTNADAISAVQNNLTAVDKKIGWQLLKTTSHIITEGGAHIDLDISDIDLSQYPTLHIRVNAKGSGSNLFLAVQNTYLRNNSFSPTAGPICLTLWTMREKNAIPGGMIFGYSNPVLLPFSDKVKDLKQISLYCSSYSSGTITSGTLSLYGEL